MSLVLVTGGSGFIGGHCILQTLAAGHSVRATLRNPARADEVRSQLERAGDVRSRPALLRRRRPRARRRLARGGRGLRLRPPRRLAVSLGRAQERRRPDQARARRRAAGAQGRPLRWRETRGSDVIDRRRRLRPPRVETVRRRRTGPTPSAANVGAYRQVEDARRARGLGLCRQGGRSGIGDRQSRPASWARRSGPDTSTSVGIIQRLLNGAMPGLPKDRFRRRRRARRRRPAPARHDGPQRQGRAFHRDRRRFHVPPRDRAHPQGAPGRGRAPRADSRTSRLARPARRPRRSVRAPDRPRARQARRTRHPRRRSGFSAGRRARARTRWSRPPKA